MIAYRKVGIQTLESVFPDFLNGGGIFDYMRDYPWNQSIDDSYSLNADYYLNRSGRKVAAPLVSRLVDEDTGVLEEGAITALARIIRIKYGRRWDKIWNDYASLVSPLANVDITEEVNYGKTETTSSEQTSAKTGTETTTKTGTETREEGYDPRNPYRTSRSIEGSYTDKTDGTDTRTGAEEVLETFPVDRKSTKQTTGGYSDTDSTTNTRTGSQKVTDLGQTQNSVYGFNSSDAVGSSLSGPSSSAGLTSETTYGENGLVDAKSGAIVRAYNPETGLIEETTESGSRKLATTYGQDGLVDATDSTVTRTYNDYEENVEQTGNKITTVTPNTETVLEHDVSEVHDIDKSVVGSGKDTKTKVGMDTKLSDKFGYITALYTDPAIYDFFEVVFADIDSVLTCPIFV